MTWNADNRKRQGSGIRFAEGSVVAVRALAASSPYAPGCTNGLGGHPAALPVAFDEQDTR